MEVEKNYTTKQVSEILQISEWSVRRYLREGHLKGFRLSGRWWRIKESDLHQFIESQGGGEG